MAEKRQKKQAVKAFEKETFSKDKEATGVKHTENRQDNTFPTENHFHANEKPVSNLPRDANHGSDTKNVTSGHNVQKSETGAERKTGNKKKYYRQLQQQQNTSGHNVQKTEPEIDGDEIIDLGDEKMPASTVSYGVIVSDVIRATDDKYEFTLWNGTDTIDVVTSDSGFAKFQAVEYVKNSDGTYDIDAAKNGTNNVGAVQGFNLYSIMDHTSTVVQMANDQNTAKNYNLTKDTQIIYVDTSADNVEDICVNGGSIENASPAPEGKYYRNEIGRAHV